MTHRRFEGETLVVASHNEGKVREIRDLLAPFGVQTVSARELGLEEPDETGKTFKANAELKALAAARASGLPALADDSGLCVDALEGAPGIYSARWAGPAKDFRHAMERVQAALDELSMTAPEERRAHFTCALALGWPDGHVETFEGHVHGALVWPPRGDKGFGYDPLFVPEDHDVTFGEMAPARKHAMSHRTEAFRLLIKSCFEA